MRGAGVVVFAALALAACGGGDGDGGATSIGLRPIAQVPAPAPVPQRPGVPAPGSQQPATPTPGTQPTGQDQAQPGADPGDAAPGEQQGGDQGPTEIPYQGEPFSGDYGIVYARVPRTGSVMVMDDGTRIAQWFLDWLPEVSNIFHNFNAPGQLVWRHADGKETIIFDCVNGMPELGIVPPSKPWSDPELREHDEACVPMDPAVSFDGKRVAFSVYFGGYGKGQYQRHDTDVGRLTSKGNWAQIYIYDFESRQLTAWPHPEGALDTAPVWLPDGKMMFTSNRSGHVKAKPGRQENITKAGVLQLWLANQDGSDARGVGQQDQYNALHPWVHSSGRVFYSSLQPMRMRWMKGGKSSGTETEGNLWWMMSVDRRGGDLNAHVRAHNFWNAVIDGMATSYYTDVTAPHFFGELSNGDMCFDNYYRGNNFGAGGIICWPTRGSGRSPADHEGAYPFKNGPDGMYIAVAGDRGDAGADAPHLRDPAGLPGGAMLLAGGIGKRGRCHIPNTTTVPRWTENYLSGADGNHNCDMGIYEVPADVLPLHRGDFDAYETRMRLVVNDPAWHEFMPKPVLPYGVIYGIVQPATPPLPSTGDASYAVFGSADARFGDLLAEAGWRGPAGYEWCHFQGCAIQSLVEEIVDLDGKRLYDRLHEIKAVRFWQILPNNAQIPGWGSGREMRNMWGHRVQLLGDVPIEADGSFQAKLPPDVPFLMAGVDAQGRSLARHQSLMSLRPGEKQVCGGCHLHSPADADMKDFEHSVAASKSPVAPQGGRAAPLDWRTDIYPMLQQNCASCHSDAVPPDFGADADTLYVELTNIQGSHPGPAFHRVDPGIGDLSGTETIRSGVPWMTRYINMLFSRESLLYWKAAGQRLDGRTDADLPEIKDGKYTEWGDFDFGPAHAAHLNSTQLQLLSDWIEEGLYYSVGN